MTEFSELLTMAGYRCGAPPDHAASAPDLSRSYSSPSATPHPRFRGPASTHITHPPSSSSPSSSSSSSSASSSPYPQRPPFALHHSSCPDVAQSVPSGNAGNVFAHARYAQSDCAEEDFRRERSQSYDSLDSGDGSVWVRGGAPPSGSGARASPAPSYSQVSPVREGGMYSGWQDPGYGLPATNPCMPLASSMSPLAVPASSASSTVNAQPSYIYHHHQHQHLQQHQQYAQHQRHHQQQQQQQQQQYHSYAHGMLSNQSAWVPGQYTCPDYQ